MSPHEAEVLRRRVRDLVTDALATTTGPIDPVAFGRDVRAALDEQQQGALLPFGLALVDELFVNEARERARTGIQALKIRYHPVHGYAIEVSKTNLARVPDDYERKQTLANAERFTTSELRRIAEGVRGGTEQAAALERTPIAGVRCASAEEAVLRRVHHVNDPGRSRRLV